MPLFCSFSLSLTHTHRAHLVLLECKDVKDLLVPMDKMERLETEDQTVHMLVVAR